MLEESGFGSLALSPEDFAAPNKAVQLGVPPVRVDMITSVSGVTWEKADTGKVPGRYAEIPVFFISREDFLTNKRTIADRMGAADIETLGEK